MTTRNDWENLNINPYPNNNWKTITSPASIINIFGEKTKEELYEINMKVNSAGRLRFKNEMGKLGFGRIQSDGNQIQFVVRKQNLSEQDWIVWKNLDVGDHVYFSGTITRTKTDELSIDLSNLMLAADCQETMPDKIDGISDIEIKYRQRYLDLLSNQETINRFKFRSKVTSFVRNYLENNLFLECETPILHSIPGGAFAKPFITHHNKLNSDFYLRIAPELYLKRLLVGGFSKVFELNRNFRNEGVSTKHNPEFTMVEFYSTYWNYNNLIEFITTFIQMISNHFSISNINYNEHCIDINNISVKSYQELISSLGINPWNLDDMKAYLHNNNMFVNIKETVGHYQEYIFSEFIESSLIDPTFVINYPIEISPLAKTSDVDNRVTERFELFIGGMEIANGFTELNDPQEQSNRFLEQVKEHNVNDEAMHYDEDYIKALMYGLPPCAGAGIGIDRLVMLLTGSTSIKDIILFPALNQRSK